MNGFSGEGMSADLGRTRCTPDWGKTEACMARLGGHLLAMLTLLGAAVQLTGTGRAQTREDLPTEPILRVETGQHGSLIHRIDTDAENHFAVTASDDNTVRLWSLLDGRQLQILRLPLDFGGLGKASAVAMSPDGSTIAVGGSTGRPTHHNIFLFDRASGKLIKPVSDLPDGVGHLAYSPDGQRLAASLEGTNGIRVFDVGNNYRQLSSDTQYGDSSYSAGFDRTGRLLTTSDDGFVRLYAADRFAAPIQKIRSGGDPYMAAFSPDGTRVAVGFYGSRRVAVLSGLDLAKDFEADTAGVPDVDLKAVAWSQDGRFLFAGGSWSVNDVWRVRRWGDGGRGAFVDIPTASETIMEIVGLKSGSMLFAHTDGFGLISPDAKARQLQKLGGLDLRSADGLNLRVSTDGGTVQVDSFEPRRTYRFGLRERRVDNDPPIDSTPLAPITQAPGLNVTNWYDSTTPAVNGTPIMLQPDEAARSLAIVHGKQHFVLGADWSVHLFDQLGHENWVDPVPGEAWHVNVTGDGRLAVVAYGDGTIRWLRLSDGKELLALFMHPDGKRWVVWTPQGYYDASVGGDELIGWHVNHGYDRAPDFYSVSQFRDQFYRRDIVALVLKTLDVGEAVRRANAVSGRKTPTAIANSLPPIVKIVSPPDGSTQFTSPIPVTYLVKSPTRVTAIEVRVGGRPVPATQPKEFSSGEESALDALQIDVPPHDVLISLIAANENAPSEASLLNLKWGGTREWDKPNLYVLSVGVSHYKYRKLDLTFPHKDAEDFVRAMKDQEGNLYQRVLPFPLPNDRPTLGSILDGLDWLQKNTTSRDIAVLFLSGHGETDMKGHYRFLPFEADLAHRIRTTLKDSDIVDNLRDVRGRVIAFIDTCYSGGLNLTGQPDVNKLANDLTKSSHVIVFTSSSDNEVSIENPKWNNGAFTKALVEAFIKGGIDLRDPNSIAALDNFVENRVNELTHGQQHPRLAKPRTIEGFDIANVVP
jgi:WD40 repeat protein